MVFLFPVRLDVRDESPQRMQGERKREKLEGCRKRRTEKDRCHEVECIVGKLLHVKREGLTWDFSTGTSNKESPATVGLIDWSVPWSADDSSQR